MFIFAEYAILNSPRGKSFSEYTKGTEYMRREKKKSRRARTALNFLYDVFAGIVSTVLAALILHYLGL